MNNKKEILNRLIENLKSLIKILELDPKPPFDYARIFWGILQDAEHLQKNGFKNEDLISLSSSIDSTSRPFSDYGGPGTYNPDTGKYSEIPGTENFDKVSNQVFDLATQLRISDGTENLGFRNIQL